MLKLVQTNSLFSALDYASVFCLNNKNEKLDIVVPDKLSLFMERYLFEKLNITASFNITVATLNRFAKRNNVVDKKNQISKLGSIILINKILNENAGNFKVVVSKNYSFSYAEEIYKTIYQLKASKINAEEMFLFKNKNDQLTNKIHDLAIIYQQYEQQKSGLIDSSDMFLLSTFNISEGRENHKILFVGFDDFTAIEYSLIEQLAKNCDVSVVSYKSKTSNAYIFNDEVRLQLKNLAYINNLGYEEEEYFAEVNELKQFLQNNLFGLKNETYAISNSEIEIFSASNPVDELEYVARDIKTKILSGEGFSSFGLAVYDLESRVDKIEEIFDKYDINYYIDMPLTINKSIYYKFLVSVFKFNFEFNNLQHVIDLISSPFFVADKNKKQLLITALINIKFKGKTLKYIKFDEELHQIAFDVDKFLSLFVFKKDVKTMQLKTQLLTAMEIIDGKNILTEIADNTELKYQILLKKSYEEINNLFDEVEKFYPLITAEEFYQIFLHLSQVVEINNLPLTLDAVKVVDANNFSEVFDNLYFVNCTSLTAPSLKHDCGIILDDEIEQLNFSHKLAPTIAHINKLQKLRLFNSALLFNKSLYITYIKSQSELIKDLCAKILVKVGNAQVKLHPQYKNVFADYVALSNKDYIYNLAIYNKSNNDFYSNDICFVDKSLPIFNFNKVSASMLEHYFTCPFYCFINDLLKIRPRLEPEVLALDVGNILHQVVYLYYKLNKKVDNLEDFVTSQIKNFLEKEERLKINLNSPIITQLIKECIRIINGLDYIDKNSNYIPTYFEFAFNKETSLKLNEAELVGKVDRVDLLKLKDSSSVFRIVDYKTGNANASLSELYYGKKLQLFLYNKAMENVLKIQGVGSFYLPLHNKYEKKESFVYSLAGFYENEEELVQALDKRLQPGDKSDIVNLTLNKEGKAKALSEKIVNKEDFNLLKTYSINVADQAIKEIKSGFILPSPFNGKQSCQYCPYAQICLKKANAINFRQKADVKLQSFKESK